MGTVGSESIEARVAAGIARHHREQQGHAPSTIRAYVVGEMVLVYSSGIFTPTEQNLCETEEGRKLVKSARRELRSLSRRAAEGSVATAVGCDILRSFWDLDIRSGEQIEVYLASRPLSPVR